MKKDEELSPELYRVARTKGTEAPFSGAYVDTHERGVYHCAICGIELFSSDVKFDSGTGWPSFTEPMNLQNVELKEDKSYGMARTEVLCRNCGAHLGHVFDDLPAPVSQRDKPTGVPAEKRGKYYCINSVCLDLVKKKEDS